MPALVAGIHVFTRANRRRGWHRKSGLPDFRIKNVPQVGYIRLAVTSPAMTVQFETILL